MYEFLLVFGVIVWIVAVAVYINRGIASIYHPASYYLFFHGFIFVIRPIFNWWYEFQLVYRLYQFTPSMHDKIMALVAANVGFIAFMIPVLTVAKDKFIALPTIGRRPDTQRSAREALVLACAVCAPLGLYSLWLLVKSHSGGALSNMVLDSSTGIAYNTTSNGYLTDANTMLAPLVVLIAWQFRFRLWSLVPFMGFAVARLYIGNGRWSFVMAAASLALLYLYDRRKTWFEWRAVVGGALILSAFTVVGANRAYFRDLLAGNKIQSSSTFDQRPLEGMDYANQEYLEYLVYVVPQRSGTYDYFLDNLQVLTEPIPRTLWPGKPIGPPIQLYKLWDYGQPIGMTNSIVGEGWQQLGLIGVAIWCGLFGYILGVYYRWFVRSRQTMIQVALYAMTLPLSIQFFRDGTLVTFVKFPLFVVLPILLWKVFAGISFHTTPARTKRPTGVLAPRPLRHD